MSDVILCRVPESEKCPSGLKIVVPSPSVSMKTALKTIPGDTIEHKVVHKSEAPQDRYFRNAWKMEGEKINVDMPKAKNIHIEKLRKKRNEMLDSLDKEFMISLETGDKAKQDEVKGKKQKLRDMPTDAIFSSPATPELLKATIPDYMKG